jgi:hypothetical protein
MPWRRCSVVTRRSKGVVRVRRAGSAAVALAWRARARWRPGLSGRSGGAMGSKSGWAARRASAASGFPVAYSSSSAASAAASSSSCAWTRGAEALGVLVVVVDVGFQVGLVEVEEAGLGREAAAEAPLGGEGAVGEGEFEGGLGV